MDAYILDTNLLFNMEAGLNLGEKTELVIKRLTAVASTKQYQFILPPRVVDEILSFFDNKEQPFLKEFLAAVTIQSPSFNEMMVPAAAVYQLVEDIRNRSYRGMTVAEEEIQNAGKLFMGKEQLTTKDFQITIGTAIKGFRDRYRQATRFGFLDSVADLDLIMLAKETGATVVSTDEGVLKWARVFGVKEMPAFVFGEKMKAA